MKTLLTERDVIDTWKQRGTEILITPTTIVTPAAADAANARRIEIRRPHAGEEQTASARATTEELKWGTIVLGADHGGFELKETLKAYLLESGFEVEDVGTHSSESVDYPDFASAVSERVARSEGARGVIVDGAGIGSAMTANKVPGIRAAVCQDTYTARNSRAHNNANILTLGSRVLGVDVAKEILLTWLQTAFEGGRHQYRVDKMMAVERKYLS